MEKILITFFQRVANKEQEELKNLYGYSGFKLETNNWYFTLPNLFSYLLSQNIIDREVSYTQFRKQLFNCPINQKLKELGAEVKLYDNKTNVDKSEYVLVWNK